MTEPTPSGIIAWMDAMLGGAATTLIAAITMRMIYHNQEVRKHRRPMIGIELLFEAPIAVGMALIGDALAGYLDLSHAASIGVVAVLSFMGPRGAQSMVDRWVSGKIGGDN